MKDKAYTRAVVFLCAAIAASVLLGGCRSVYSCYRSAVAVYSDSADGQSAEDAAASLLGNAKNLLKVARRNSVAEKVAVSLSNSIEKAEQAKELSEKKENIVSVCNDSRLVYDELGLCELTDSDKTYRTELFYNIRSCYSVLCHDVYNTAATEFNAVIKAQPARLFSGLIGKNELPVFNPQDVILEGSK